MREELLVAIVLVATSIDTPSDVCRIQPVVAMMTSALESDDKLHKYTLNFDQ